MWQQPHDVKLPRRLIKVLGEERAVSPTLKPMAQDLVRSVRNAPRFLPIIELPVQVDEALNDFQHVRVCCE